MAFNSPLTDRFTIWVKIARRLSIERDALRLHLLDEPVDLLVQAFVKRPQDAVGQRLPGVAAQQWRNERGIELRPRVGLGRLFEAGDRQHIVAGHIVLAHEKLAIQRPHGNGLRVAARVFVLGLDRLLMEAHTCIALGRQIAPSQCECGHRQWNQEMPRILVLKGGPQVDGRQDGVQIMAG